MLVPKTSAFPLSYIPENEIYEVFNLTNLMVKKIDKVIEKILIEKNKYG